MPMSSVDFLSWPPALMLQRDFCSVSTKLPLTARTNYCMLLQYLNYLKSQLLCRILVNPTSLHFVWVVDDAKCIVITRVCGLSVCLSAVACLHYCTDPDVTWGSGRGCPLVVHYWADLQSRHGLRCYGNVTRTRNVSENMLVLALCLVSVFYLAR